MTKEDIGEINKQLSIEVDTDYGYDSGGDAHTIRLKWGDEVISEEAIYTSSS